MNDVINLESKFKAVVIGTSAGGLHALLSILEGLPAKFSIPIIIVQHRSKDQRDLLEFVLQSKCEIKIKQADEKEDIEDGVVYIAPPDYHLLVEHNETFSLTSDEQINYSRPSIDVLFETAAMVYRESLVAIILTGANKDGADGIRTVQEYGGLTIAQNPNEAEFSVMPESAIKTHSVKRILTLEEIKKFLIKIGSK